MHPSGTRRRPPASGLILLMAALWPLVGCAADPAEPGRAPALVLAGQASERLWVGPEWFANRLADWRLRDGRAACIEPAPRFPLRTLMALDTSLARGDGQLTTRVRTGPAGSVPLALPAAPAVDRPSTTQGLRGLLLGAGGDHVDPRLSAMVHHRPARDGGLLAAVDDRGRVALYDMGADSTTGGSWSIGGPLRDDELPLLAAGSLPDPQRLPGDGLLDLQVEARVEGPRTLLSIRSFAPSDPALPLSTLEVVLADRPLDGLLGLVSHLGPQGSAEGYAFGSWERSGDLLRWHDERRFGPVVATHYTVSDGQLNLTAQLVPLAPGSAPHELVLELEQDGHTTRHPPTRIDDVAWTASFRLPLADPSRPASYQVICRPSPHEPTQRYAGTVRAEPPPTRPFVVASLNCQKIFTGGLQWNHHGVWFPHAETARAVAGHDPDLLFFAGDQIYEGDLDPVDARDEDRLILDYLYKWYRHCWSFGELTRHVPSVVLPDDHDVYHGNLWGAGGRRAQADPRRGLTAQDSGGYKHGPRFVNAVHATQTGHLPPPVDPAPCDQGISVYFTRLDWAGLSCAILADRQFKSSASVLVPDGQVVNGWFQAEGFDPRDADVPGAVLLGDRQERFLEAWASDGEPWARLALSQTPFVNVATIPEKAEGGGVLPSLPIPEPGEYPEGYRFAADTDSGGWPQTPRDRAVSLLARAGALHLAGDQHLGSLVQYGVDEHRDAGFAFTAPAVANTWPRRWWPPIHGANPDPGAPHYAGDFVDGFGNLLTVWAVANPVRSGREPAALYDRTPGYGIVRLDPVARTATLECWPRWVDPQAPDAQQYEGWPRTIPLPR